MTAGVTAIKILFETAPVFARIKVIGMTRCAGTGILWKSIAYAFVIVGVTRNTGYPCVVVARIVAAAGMRVVNGRPAVG